MSTTFFRDFTFDTLLGCISCILGIAALFVGTKAYKKCKIAKSSLNDQKEFYDSSSDRSQKVYGDIINNNCDVEALANITAANFDICLKQAYDRFEQQNKINLQQILERTKQIIREEKPNIAGLTKIDWINVYFESAKNTSDEYIQNIWAKVLKRELEAPGSFSYKTLDVLKNMSSDDFKCFEKLCSLEIEGWIFQENIYDKYGLSYTELLKLTEYGLLNMKSTSHETKIKEHESLSMVYNSLLILWNNTSDKEIDIQIIVYLLSSVANELLFVANYKSNEDYAKDCVALLSKLNTQAKITLHRINHIIGNEIDYDSKDLCS